MTWWMGKLSDKINLRKIINRHHKNMGLEPIQDTLYHVLGYKAIVATDSVLGEVPSDVEIPVSQTGYMHLSQQRQDSPELNEFLNRGSPPVYAGFGSMPRQDQINILPMIVEAVRLNGLRAVISRFWDEPFDDKNDGDIFFIQKYPHLQLFPHMAAVIHHGGAGTTATSAISGVPQVIIPHILDQYYWGHRIYLSGLGPKPIWRSKLTAQTLAEAIQECLSNERIRKTAQKTGQCIKQRDGIALTVREILNK
jgi:UDP:flavonoid glycosyltransferase YjiC (YdhE family)